MLDGILSLLLATGAVKARSIISAIAFCAVPSFDAQNCIYVGLVFFFNFLWPDRL